MLVVKALEQMEHNRRKPISVLPVVGEQKRLLGLLRLITTGMKARPGTVAGGRRALTAIELLVLDVDGVLTDGPNAEDKQMCVQACIRCCNRHQEQIAFLSGQGGATAAISTLPSQRQTRCPHPCQQVKGHLILRRRRSQRSGVAVGQADQPAATSPCADLVLSMGRHPDQPDGSGMSSTWAVRRKTHCWGPSGTIWRNHAAADPARRPGKLTEAQRQRSACHFASVGDQDMRPPSRLHQRGATECAKPFALACKRGRCS